MSNIKECCLKCRTYTKDVSHSAYKCYTVGCPVFDKEKEQFDRVRAERFFKQMKERGRIKFDGKSYTIDEFFKNFMMELHDGIINIDDLEFSLEY